MPPPYLLYHYADYQPLWAQENLIQAGPFISTNSPGIKIVNHSVRGLKTSLEEIGLNDKSILIHYTDPFFLSKFPLEGLNKWHGPKLLACGDLHHGNQPLNTLDNYLKEEAYDAVLITFNPSLLGKIRSFTNIPVHSYPPSFFRYPKIKKEKSPIMHLLHVGSIGAYHDERRQLITSLIKRENIPFSHVTTSSSLEASVLYSKAALVLNIPLNNDLNHRFFEVMGADTPQIIFGDPSIYGPIRSYDHRPDIFWASSIEQVESITNELLSNKSYLNSIQVEPPEEYSIESLMKKIFRSQVVYPDMV